MPRRFPSPGFRTCLLVLVLVLMGAPLPARAQSGPEPAGPEFQADAADGVTYDQAGAEDPGWWHGFRGAPEPNRLYLENWALHLKRMNDGLSAHHLLGATWRGFYLATFVNTHDRRTWTAGVGRYLVGLRGSEGSFQMGYRAGLVRGYDHQLMEIAERWPAIPAAQITADARFRRVGMQAGWSWIVVTFGGFIEL